MWFFISCVLIFDFWFLLLFFHFVFYDFFFVFFIIFLFIHPVGRIVCISRVKVMIIANFVRLNFKNFIFVVFIICCFPFLW